MAPIFLVGTKRGIRTSEWTAKGAARCRADAGRRLAQPSAVRIDCPDGSASVTGHGRGIRTSEWTCRGATRCGAEQGRHTAKPGAFESSALVWRRQVRRTANLRGSTPNKAGTRRSRVRSNPLPWWVGARYGERRTSEGGRRSGTGTRRSRVRSNPLPWWVGAKHGERRTSEGGRRSGTGTRRSRVRSNPLPWWVGAKYGERRTSALSLPR